MRVLCLLMLMVWPVSASTVLPGSYVSFGGGSGGNFEIYADDGFFVIGGHALLWDGVWNGTDPVRASLGFGAWTDLLVTSVSSPWVAGEGFGAVGDGIFFEFTTEPFLILDGSVPFTFEGFAQGGSDVGNPNTEAYYFSGTGTFYLEVDPGDPEQGIAPYTTSARFVFETTPVPEVPEPGTWALILSGLFLLRDRYRARSR